MGIRNKRNRGVTIHDIDIDKILRFQDALKKVAKHKAECRQMLAADLTNTVSHKSKVCKKYHC